MYFQYFFRMIGVVLEYDIAFSNLIKFFSTIYFFYLDLSKLLISYHSFNMEFLPLKIDNQTAKTNLP